MAEPERWIDLEKRNRLIAKYAPELLEPDDDWDGDLEGVPTFSIDTSRVPPGTDIGPIFSDPEKFVGMTADQVAEALAAQQDQPKPSVLIVSLDDFFDGNGDPGSIAVNLSGTAAYPGLGVIRDTLRAIRSRPDVLDVRIEVIDWPNPLMRADDNEWPGAEAVFIWTTAPPDEVEQWVEPLQVDGFGELDPVEAASISGKELGPAVRVYRLGWD